MSTRFQDGRRVLSAWVLSVVAHGAVLFAGALLVANTLSPGRIAIAQTTSLITWNEELIPIELPVVTGSLLSSTESAPDLQARLERGGGEGTPRPDMALHGRGGADAVEQPAFNLADRDDEMFLSPEVRSRLDRNQVQRIHSDKQRASREDWRASREPMELTFLASGKAGKRPERRRNAEHDPSLGDRDHGAPTDRGSVLGAEQLRPGTGESARLVGSNVLGVTNPSQGLGVRDGQPGSTHQDSALVAFARPMVPESTPSVPASAMGKPSDTVDSEQEVATSIQSLLRASTAGGQPGPGTGGEKGPGAVGSGGLQGPGSSARALGSGKGVGLDNNPLDQRRNHYMRQVMAKIHPHWAHAFPKWAAAQGLQGTVIVTFVIRADGSVAGASIARPSGIAEFDENCRRAVLKAAPFPPLPPELGQSFRWSMPFDAKNPAVLPKK